MQDGFFYGLCPPNHSIRRVVKVQTISCFQSYLIPTFECSLMLQKSKTPLLEFTNKGLYCPIGQFYIDPFYPVDYAVITHAHADHARLGMKFYLAHKDSIPIMKIRLGMGINFQAVDYNQNLYINGVNVSFHPAGHIIGSSQIRVEYKGEVWLVSGDYKLEDDGISAPYEAVKCHTFITECTFGLPIFNWKPQQTIFDDINLWWKTNADNGIASIIYAYSLGKAQRILFNIDSTIGPVFEHTTIHTLNQALIESGLPVPKNKKADNLVDKSEFSKALIIAPPSGKGSSWEKKFGASSQASASGWMAIRGFKNRANLDKGFVLSDHSDWGMLLKAIEINQAERVITTHGYTSVFSRYLNEIGIESIKAGQDFEDQFGTEEVELEDSSN